ncbi:MAG: hypothetical protein FJ284_13550 [Planctomycetes bacterium]|nr:hypothetical protein [Planctomycetota bacterium]
MSTPSPREGMMAVVRNRRAMITGAQLDGHSYVNDHLRHEFSQRVSKKRKLLLYSRLAEALKHFAVHVTRDEEVEEEAMIRSAT